MNRWQRFTKVELPSSAIGLMWNSMMSFGGGWFFVAQSEAISVMNKNIKLPGLGSYMAAAVEAGDTRAAVYAIVAMIITIVVLDQLVWRPLVAWAEKFKLEQTEGKDNPTSWVLDLLRRSYVLAWFSDHVGRALGRVFAARVDAHLGPDASDLRSALRRRSRRCCASRCGDSPRSGVAWLVFDAIDIAKEIRTDMTGAEMLHVVWLGVLTLLRVVAMSVIATLIWTPIGVWIGLRPRVARVAQPLAQIAASFPVNMTFPFIVAFFIAAAHPDQSWQRAPDGARHAVVHPVQRHRRRDGDAHRSARSRHAVRPAPLAPLEDADHSRRYFRSGSRAPLPRPAAPGTPASWRRSPRGATTSSLPMAWVRTSRR